MASKICVVIPAYNASKTIRHVVRGALKYVPTVIVADDGSIDNTAQIATEAGAEVIVIDRNRGKGHALKMLFQRTINEGYDVVISMDADSQHNPEDIHSFIHTHKMHPDDIIVGSRMHKKEKIPRRRYNSMHIARFYISLAANQFIEDTQCGFRLYPLSLIKRILLTTDRYVTETEILMKAGDMGASIRFVNIRVIYGENCSHFRPVIDIAAISSYVISYLTIKWFVEGASSDRPFTYSPNNIHDLIGRHKTIYLLFKTTAVFTALPFSLLWFCEYILLSPIIKNNFTSVRRVGCGFFKITLATHTLPIILIIAIFEKSLGIVGIKIRLVHRFIERFYPNLWDKKDNLQQKKILKKTCI